MLPQDLGVTPDLQRMPADVRLLLTLVILVGGLLVRYGAVRLIRGQGVLSDTRRWWMISARNGLSALIVLALAVLWLPEIEEFALSITAFALAFVIATKELLLCVSGATWASITRVFDVGDWIEIGDHSGEVFDANLFVTQLQEIEPREYRYTGRTIGVPNSLMLTEPVINHRFRKRFLQHEFKLCTPPDPRAAEVRAAVEAALLVQSEGFAEVARRYAAVIQRRAGIKLPDVRATVRLETNAYANLEYRCALFCPSDRVGEMERVAMDAMLKATTADGAADRARAREPEVNAGTAVAGS